jgi:hypothetical protein
MISSEKCSLRLFLKVAFCIGVFFLILQLCYFFSKYKGTSIQLVDSDCYLWLVRSELLNHHFHWYPEKILRINPPYGDELHWSRWMDLCLFLPAKALSLFMSFKKALFYWGILFSPVLLIPLACLMAWLANLYLKSTEAVLFALFYFMLQPGEHIACLAGRPDHHSLLLLLFLIVVCLLMYGLHKNLPKLAIAAAGVTALSVAVSLETLILVGLVYCTIYGAWLLRSRKTFQIIRCFIFALPIWTLLMYALARSPEKWGWMTLDQLSWIHVYFMLFPCLAVEIMNLFWDMRFTFLRSIFPVIVGLIVAAPFCIAFPDFLHGPYAQVDPQVHRVWLTRVGEVLPLISKEKIRWTEIIWVVAPALPGLWLCMARIRDKQQSEEMRICWLLSFLILFAYAGLTLYQFRWAYYIAVAVAIPWAACYEKFQESHPSWFDKMLVRVPIKVAALFCWVVCAGVVSKFAGVGTDSIKDPKILKLKDREFKEDLPFAKLCDWIEEQSQWRDKTLNILCFVNRGTELLYRTHHNVFGTPYHRNAQGIMDEYHIMTSPNDRLAHMIIHRRHVDMIIICRSFFDEAAYYNDDNTDHNFHRRLIEGDCPPWLEKVPLPSMLAKSYQIYTISPL